MALILCHLKPEPTDVICYNSSLPSQTQSYDHLPGDDHLDGDHLVDVDQSESQHMRSEKHCRRLRLRRKHLIITRLLIVAIVIKVVMIIRQKSNNKSEFNNCISTEREIDGRLLGIVGLSLKNEAYQYFVAELFWLQVLICITIR